MEQAHVRQYRMQEHRIIIITASRTSSRFQRHDGRQYATLTLVRTDIEIRREERCDKEAEAAGDASWRRVSPARMWSKCNNTRLFAPQSHAYG